MALQHWIPRYGAGDGALPTFPTGSGACSISNEGSDGDLPTFPTRCSTLDYGSPMVARIPTSSLDLSPFIGDDEEPGRPATGDLLPARPVNEAGPRSSSDEQERLSYRAGFSRLLCLPGVRRPHAPPRALAPRAEFSCAAAGTGSSSDCGRCSRLGVEGRPWEAPYWSPGSPHGATVAQWRDGVEWRPETTSPLPPSTSDPSVWHRRPCLRDPLAPHSRNTVPPPPSRRRRTGSGRSPGPSSACQPRERMRGPTGRPARRSTAVFRRTAAGRRRSGHAHSSGRHHVVLLLILCRRHMKWNGG